jgi:tetratricopeptide (TPR) repeat protein
VAVSTGTRLLLAAVITLAAGAALSEEILYLKNGRRIRVDRYWEVGDQLYYERDGNVFGFPSRLLAHVDRVRSEADARNDGDTDFEPGAGSESAPGFRNEIATETIIEARRSTREGDVDRAVGLYRRAIRTAPDSVTSRYELAQLYFERGDYYAAQSQLEQAKRVVQFV